MSKNGLNFFPAPASFNNFKTRLGQEWSAVDPIAASSVLIGLVIGVVTWGKDPAAYLGILMIILGFYHLENKQNNLEPGISPAQP